MKNLTYKDLKAPNGDAWIEMKGKKCTAPLFRNTWLTVAISQSGILIKDAAKKKCVKNLPDKVIQTPSYQKTPAKFFKAPIRFKLTGKLVLKRVRRVVPNVSL